MTDRILSSNDEVERLKREIAAERIARADVAAELARVTDSYFSVLNELNQLRAGNETEQAPDYVQFGWVPYHDERGADPDSFIEREESQGELIEGWRYVPAFAAIKARPNLLQHTDACACMTRGFACDCGAAVRQQRARLQQETLAPPAGDYVLVSDMVPGHHWEYGEGLFATQDSVRPAQKAGESQK